MSGLRWMLCGLALTLTACVASNGDETPAATPDTATAVQEIMIPRALHFQPADENCTDTYGACMSGKCELPRDTFQHITEVCCDANGANCTTELYKLCGC